MRVKRNTNEKYLKTWEKSIITLSELGDFLRRNEKLPHVQLFDHKRIEK